jgi:hypothetical protein
MFCQGRLVSSLVLLLSLTACGSAGPGWASFPVTLYGDQTLLSTPEANADFQDAMAFWEAQAGGKQLFDYKGIYTGPTPFSGTPTSMTEINTNVIQFQNPWPFANNIVGQTTTFAGYGGQIQSAVIMINPNTAFCTGDCTNQTQFTSRRKAFTHELGHFIGLVHIQDTQNIMNPEITPGGTLDGETIDQATFTNLTKAAQ